MKWLLLLGLAIALIASVTFRVLFFHPFKLLFYGCKDLYRFIRFKLWRLCKTGKLICFVGLFGKGKTLSAVHYVVDQYRRYNDKMVFDFGRNRWVLQKVHVISNVDLCIPFERFTGLAQIVRVAEKQRFIDSVNDTLTYTLVLGDEFSVQLNSRSFKTNIDPLFLNTLLTCRHHHISLVYTSQRFNHVDALLRQVTSEVISCDKLWRIMRHGSYDAYELENASDPTMVKPRRRMGWFIRDRDYNAYDTLACVGNLVKSCQAGDMLSEEEILALQSPGTIDNEQVTSPSSKNIRLQKKRNKVVKK